MKEETKLDKANEKLKFDDEEINETWKKYNDDISSFCGILFLGIFIILVKYLIRFIMG